MCLVCCNSGFETTADIHTAPANVAHHSYGAISLSATPSVAVVGEIVADDLVENRNIAESGNRTADDLPQVGEVSIEILVPIDMPAADHTVVAPDNAVVAPDNDVVAPDNAVVAPDNAVV